jgi:hypothetical protein
VLPDVLWVLLPCGPSISFKVITFNHSCGKEEEKQLLPAPAVLNLQYTAITLRNYVPPGKKIGIRGSFPGVKWLKHEADHSRPPGVEVMNEWSYTPNLTHPYIFMQCTRINVLLLCT